MENEKIQTDMKTLAEIQSSFSDELDSSKDSEDKTLGERLLSNSTEKKS